MGELPLFSGSDLFPAYYYVIDSFGHPFCRVVRDYIKNNSLTSVGAFTMKAPTRSLKRNLRIQNSFSIDLKEIEETLIESVKLITMAPELEDSHTRKK